MTKLYRRINAVESFLVDEECVILHPEQCTITKLNEVGQFCWELLGEARTVSSLASELQQQYQISEQDALTDIYSFLEKLLQIGLIEHAS